MSNATAEKKATGDPYAKERADLKAKCAHLREWHLYAKAGCPDPWTIDGANVPEYIDGAVVIRKPILSVAFRNMATAEQVKAVYGTPEFAVWHRLVMEAI